MNKQLKSALFGVIATGVVFLASVFMMFKDNFAGPSLMLGAGMLAIFSANIANYFTVKKRLKKHNKK